MVRPATTFALFLALAAPAFAAPAPAAPAADELKRANDVVAAWPEGPQQLAALMIQRYGPPDEIATGLLTWNDRSPWKRILVYRDPTAPGRRDNLVQAIAYQVPLRQWRMLTSFDRGARYDPVRQELAARSDREETNFLALNLADEVVQGRRTPTEANEFYDKTVSMSYAGKKSPYMEKLLFSPQLRQQPPNQEPSDPRTRALNRSELGK